MALFLKYCEECGKTTDIDDQTCSKCGFDFNSRPRVTPKCPYCEKELHIYDFCIMEVDKKGRKRFRGLLGESIGYHMRMWHCPFCGKILGFSDHATG